MATGGINIPFSLKVGVTGKDQIGELSLDMKDLDKITKSVTSSAKKFNGAEFGAAAISTSVTNAANALRELDAVMGNLSAAYKTQIEVETQLENAMRNSMGATSGQIQAVKDLCSAQQQIGVVGDEVQLAGAQMLASFVQEQHSLETLIPLMNDMAVKQYGMSASGNQLQQTASAIGKALNGQVRGLKSVGIEFTAYEKKVMESGTETDKVALLASKLSDKVGGLNSQLARTSAGGMQQFRNKLGDIQESIGSATSVVQPYVSGLASVGMAAIGVIQLVKAWQSLGLTSKATALLHTNGIKGMIQEVKMLNATFSKTAVAAKVAKVAIKGLMAATGVGLAIWGITEAVSALSSSSDKATASTRKLNDIATRVQGAMLAEQMEAKMLFERLGKLKTGTEEYNTVRHTLYDKYGDVLTKLGDEETALSDLKRAYDAVTLSIQNKAKAQFKAEAMESITQDYGEETADIRKNLLKELQKHLNPATDFKGIMDMLEKVARGEATLSEDFAKKFNVTTFQGSNMSGIAGGFGGGTTITRNPLTELLDKWAEQEKEITSKAKEVDDMFGSLFGNLATSGIDTNDPKDTSPSAPAPEGTLKHIDEQISAKQAELALIPVVDIESMGAVQAQIDALTKEKKWIEFQAKVVASGDDMSLKAVDATFKGFDFGKNSPFDGIDLTTPFAGLQKAIDSVDFSGIKAGSEGAWNALHQGVDVSGAVGQGLGSLSNMINTIAGSCNEGTAAYLQWGASVINACAQALPAIMAVTAAEAAKSAAQTPIVGWIMAGAAIAGVLAAFASIPKFAEGGIAYGPTLGIFGEYAGASNNPEVVAPLSELKNIIGTGRGDTFAGKVEFRIDGRNLKGTLDNVNRYNQRTR